MRRTHFYDFDRFRIDRSERLLFHEGKPVQLTSKVFETLLSLVQNCNCLIEKDELMKAVRPDSFVAESSLTYNISICRCVAGDK